MSISYSDGAEIESFILSLVQSADRIDSSANIGWEHYREWPVQYHLSSQRANLVRHLDWSGLKVLEVGAGLGAVSRYLAEQSKRLTIVEGTQARYDVLASRLRDLSNWDGQVGNFEDVATDDDYDVVCLIGVLEYAELYVKPALGDSSFVTMLKRARRCLKPGGAVCVAIENRLGLKYFAGCSEDHTGQMFDGICGYRMGTSPRTFSRAELRGVLAQAGLTNVVEQFPYPDYKMASCVLAEAMVDRYPTVAAELATSQAYRDYTSPAPTLFPCSLFLESVCGQPSLMKELSNSFLLLASETPESHSLHKLLATANAREEIAWHYAPSRRRPVRTIFHESVDGLAVEKNVLGDPDSSGFQYADESVEITWRNPGVEGGVYSRKLTRSLLRHAYFGDIAAMEDQLVAFIRWVLERFKLEGQPEFVDGAAIDAHVGNAFLSSDAADYVLIDQEWVLTGPMRKSWFVIRNLCNLDQDLTIILRSRSNSLREFYEHICTRLQITACFEEDIDAESRFASLLTEIEDAESVRAGIKNRFSEAVAEVGFPRTPQDLEAGGAERRREMRALTRERDQLRGEVQQWRAHHQRKIYWAPRVIDDLIIKFRRFLRRGS